MLDGGKNYNIINCQLQIICNFWPNPTFMDWRHPSLMCLEYNQVKYVEGNPAMDFCYVSQRDLWGRSGNSVKVGLGVSRGLNEHRVMSYLESIIFVNHGVNNIYLPYGIQ